MLRYLMKPAVVLFTACILTTFYAWTASNADTTMKDVKKESGEAVKTGVDYTREQYDAFLKQAQSKMDEMGRQIEKLKKKSERLGGKAQAEAKEKLQQVKEGEKAAADKVAGLKSAGDETWQKSKSAVKESLDRLDRAIQAAAKELKGDE